MRPTGILVHVALAEGHSSVSDYLKAKNEKGLPARKTPERRSRDGLDDIEDDEDVMMDVGPSNGSKKERRSRRIAGRQYSFLDDGQSEGEEEVPEGEEEEENQEKVEEEENGGKTEKKKKRRKKPKVEKEEEEEQEEDEKEYVVEALLDKKEEDSKNAPHHANIV